MAGNRDALRAEIVSAKQELLQTVDSLSPEEMLQRTPNEGWTAKDTLAHLSTITSRQREQVKAAIEGRALDAEPIDDYNDHKVTERKNWTVERLRAELEAEHAETLALLDGVSDDDLQRPFDHRRLGRITVERLWQNIPQHFRNHTADMAAVKQSAQR
jgi:uncharacterized damage-inducible protein DinB